MTEKPLETIVDVNAALEHLGWETVDDLHYWAQGNDIERFEQLVQAFATHRTEAVAAWEARVRELEGVLQPFVDIGKQTGAHGVISKKLNGFAPLTVTVTKAQMQRALNAYNARKALHDPR